MLSTRPDAGGTKIRGSLLVKGAVTFRAERILDRGQNAGTEVRSVVQELLTEGGLIEKKGVLQSPWFWVTASLVVAGAASAITYGVLYEPSTRVEVQFE